MRLQFEAASYQHGNELMSLTGRSLYKSDTSGVERLLEHAPLLLGICRVRFLGGRGLSDACANINGDERPLVFPDLLRRSFAF